MRAFQVKKGTQAQKLVESAGGPKLVGVTVDEDKLFFEEQVSIDPLQKYVQNGPRTIGGSLAARGYYGFRENPDDLGGEVLVVRTDQLEVV